jgi:hypothetical protein
MSVKVGCKDTLDLSAQLVHLTAKYENELEQIKQTLSALKNFEPEQIYIHLSNAKTINQSTLTPKHIADLCIRCKTPVPQRTVEIYFEQVTSYIDFLKLIIAYEQKAREKLAGRALKRHNKEGKQKPSEEALNELANLFCTELKYRSELYLLQKDFEPNVFDLFERFIGAENLIDTGSLRALGSRRGTLSEADVGVVMRKWDSDQDGFLNLKEFQKMLTGGFSHAAP